MAPVNPTSISKFVFLLILVLLLTGWDFSRHGIPLNEIKHGGPPKDGIPALIRPRFVLPDAGEAGYLQPGDRVIGLEISGKTKAYPINILNWHEVVNDRLGGKNVVVTFCPLCGTGMVFDAQTRSGQKIFGVSGMLYLSDMLLYDHQTESLWSQIRSQAVAGKLTGENLHIIPSTHTTWADWKSRHPDTGVLSSRTGYDRDYSRNPYEEYSRSRALYFPAGEANPAFHPKETVLGIVIDGKARAYSFGELEKSAGVVKDRLGGQKIEIKYDVTNQTARVVDGQGEILPSVTGFWFAWHAFHPETDVYHQTR